MPRLALHWSLRLYPALALAGVILDVRDANACGGCFHGAAPVVVDTGFVTDHRMVLSMSPTQTVLWDQVRFTGSPKDFAWVLPIKPGARIEMSHDAWIAALDATTQTVITGPTPPTCSGGGGGGGAAPTEYTSAGPPSGGCGGGFASGGGVSTYNVPVAEDASAGGAPAAGQGTETVQVVSQQVVGPYDAVTVHSTMGEALGDWLRANGYVLPATIQPVVDAYAGAGFDFIALKLAPGVGIQAMQPVRVVTPGADPTLPLRMVAAGVGAHVGLELYVISEGRYHPANFPDVTIDFTRLAWDPTLGLSNYTQLVQQALAAGSGTGWLTESSQMVNVGPTISPNGLSSLYRSRCTTEVYVSTCAPSMAGAPAGGDGGARDGSAIVDAADEERAQATADADGGSAVDAYAMIDASDAADVQSTDAGGPDEGGNDGGDGAPAVDEAGSSSAGGGDAGVACGSKTVQPCDDLDVAMVGIAGNPWLTRLRASFPAAALSTDMVLEATTSQLPVSSQHSTNAYTVPSYDPCPPATSAATMATVPAMQAAPPSSAGGCACRIAKARRGHGRAMDAALLLFGAAGFAMRLRRRSRRGAER
jgi:hypothetical protein